MAQLKVSLENIIPLTEARDHFSQIVAEVQKDKLYVLTKGGKPAVAIIDVKYLESITGGAVNQIHIESEIQKDPAKVGRTPMYKHDDSLKTPPINNFPPKSFSPNSQNNSSYNASDSTDSNPPRNKPLPPIPPKPISDQPVQIETPINNTSIPMSSNSPLASTLPSTSTPATPSSFPASPPPIQSTPTPSTTPLAQPISTPPAVPATPPITSTASSDVNPDTTISTSVSSPDVPIVNSLPNIPANPAASGQTVSVSVAPDIEDEDLTDKKIAQDDKPGPAQYSGDTNLNDMDI